MGSSNKKKKSQNLKNTFRTTKYMFVFLWKEKQGKLFIFIKGIMAFINAIFPISYIVFPGLIINELINEQRINILAVYIGLLIMTPVMERLVNMTINKYLYKLEMKLDLNIYADFCNHVASMDYETLEKPDIQIMKDRAEHTLDGVIQVVEELSSLLSAIIGLIAISSIIISLNLFIIILIVCIIYINSLITKRTHQKAYLLGKELSKYDKYQGAYTYMLKFFIYAKEIRLFNLKSLLINTYVESKTESNKLELEQFKFVRMKGTLHSLTNLMQQFAVYTYLIYNVIEKGLAIGSMTIYIAAVGQFSGSLGKVFDIYLSLAKKSLNIQEFIDFMDIPLRQNETGDKTPIFDKNSVIEFKNVYFKYPGSENYALENMNIKIRGDEKLCIVGVNGSGKSTFIKLLTRLYFPEKGEILLNGININEYDYKKYQRLFAPVFQDFAHYYLTLGENIVMANDYDEERLNEVCFKSGISSLVDKLPKGYDTQVGKWIDEEGVTPSGGEDQRIAIARALYHGADMFLLDEPTAALDPLQEYEIYKQFNEMITDKSAILITHRLSAVQLADNVAVFDKGRLVEYGTHKQLYNNKGIYTEMFDKQSEYYINN